MNGRSYWLGYFVNIEDARDAYNATARELHGDFARTNEVMAA